MDHLVFDDLVRRPLHDADNALGDHLSAIAELDSEALNALTNVIDGLIAKNRLRSLANDVS